MLNTSESATSEPAPSDRASSTRSDLTRPMLLVGVVTLLMGLAAIDAMATRRNRVTADEPQYLLSAISLAEDFDLDISDEIADERYHPFHERRINTQTIDLGDGRQVSPHDPLLPLLLAVPMRIGGWAAAKAFLAVMAAVTSAITVWVAVRRFGAQPSTSAWVIGSVFATPPLTSFATQVYPATASAFFVIIGVAAATGPYRRRWVWVGLAAVIALPWLSIKYIPIGAVIGGAILLRVARQQTKVPTAHLVLLASAGALYLGFHQWIYGGWTVYATGDHFVNGEWLVLGNNPDYIGRTRRLIGLLIDRGFGIGAWSPVYLVVPMALTSFARRRNPHWVLLLTVVGTGWAVATWVAFTMHGWWWPGRQIVPLMPLVAITLAVGVGRVHTRLVAIVVISAVAAINWLWLAVEATTGRLNLIVDFEQTTSPMYQIWRTALPNHRNFTSAASLSLTVAWGIFFLVASAAVWHLTPVPSDRRSQPAHPPTET